MPAAIVLAGGGPDPQLAPDLPSKAFLVLGGRPLVARVTDALRGVRSTGRIVVVGPPGPLGSVLDSSFEIVPDQGSLVDNIAAATSRLSGEPRVIAVASDLPLITAEAVEGFLALCTGDAGLYYAIVPEAAVEHRYPGARKTYVRVTDGVFTGGSVLLFDPAIIEKVRPLVERIMAGRKKPWLLAQLFGWSLATRLIAGTLSIADAEARVQEVTGIRGRAVVVESPELALDIDAERPENMKILRAVLEPNGRPGA
ncbi:MAG TPA: nucleotidyltransferase family protein [bacterium]|nr:nucleotidyltransferase family protein [bacterium]